MPPVHHRGRRPSSARSHRRKRSAIEGLEPRVLLAAAGPEGYGYVADIHPFENVVLPTGVGTERSFPDLGDNKFNFYGTNYSGGQLNIDLAGFVGFGGRVGRDDNTNLASAPFSRMLAPLWDGRWSTFGAATQQVNHKLEDTGGDARPDRLIIQWNVTDATIPREQRGTAIFQAILQLNTGDAPGDIIFNYVTLDTGSPASSNGGSATVGIKDFGYSSSRLLLAFNQADNPLVGSGKAIRIHAGYANQPRAITGGGASRDEGPGPLQVTLDGSGSTDFNQAPATLDYAWDLDLDGIYGETADNSFGDERGANPTYARPDDADGRADGIIDGPLSFPVALRVIDASGFVSYDEGFVRVNNVQPSAPTVTGPTSVAAGEVFEWTFSATDPGGDLIGFEVTWGDETRFDRVGRGDVVSHAFYQPGTYTARVFAFDTAGGSSLNEVTRTITVGPRPDVLLNSLGTLVVTTAGGDDTILIMLSSAQVRLDRNGTISTYDAAVVSAVDVSAGDGANIVSSLLDVDTRILAGTGDDDVTMTGNASNRAEVGGGNNTVTGGAGRDDVTAGDGNDVLDLGGDSNTVRAGAGDNHITLGQGFVETGAGNDTVIGTTGGEFHLFLGDGDNVATVLTSGPFSRIVTGSGNDSITTGDGPDNITSGDGADTVSSGAGDDAITAGNGASSLDAGAGNDDVTVQSAISIAGGDGNDRITAMLSVGTIDAGAGDDLVRANSDPAHPAVLHGGDGNDNLFTADGHDSIYGGAGKDTVHAGNGSDLISGGGGHDLLFGQGGKDRLYAGAGDDRLFGQGGNDRLTGHAGADSIDGGAATDRADDDPLDLLNDVEETLI